MKDEQMRGVCSSGLRSDSPSYFNESDLRNVRHACIMEVGEDKFQCPRSERSLFALARAPRNGAADRPQGHLATFARNADPAAWWQTELGVLEQIMKEVKCYAVKFDQSGAIVNELVNLVKAEG